jgi:hypothetical protein
MIYYSPTKGGFYFEERGDDIPENSIVVSQSEYDALFAGHLAGKMILPNEAGFPVLETPPPPPPPPPQKTLAELEAQLNALQAQIAAMK